MTTKRKSGGAIQTQPKTKAIKVSKNADISSKVSQKRPKPSTVEKLQSSSEDEDFKGFASDEDMDEDDTDSVVEEKEMDENEGELDDSSEEMEVDASSKPYKPTNRSSTTGMSLLSTNVPNCI